ncbi:MAG: tRNA epoxyqueuosine(34) reductase QueG [Spirochaetota bacterium]|nr:tRNA epoxyqueuosine(34) reductase QueG [Spirochaetota bacterium]
MASTFMDDLTNKIKLRAAKIGFDLVGVAPAEAIGDYSHYKQWIDNGFHADMAYMARNIEKRRDSRNLLATTQSVITVGLNYFTPDEDRVPPDWIISNYARNRDYHDIIQTMLEELSHYILELNAAAECKIYCDTGPVLERAIAMRGGLGWIGKNTCLINRKIGSYVFLGELLTSIKLYPDNPAKNYCGTCVKCIEVCPTQAITRPYQLDSGLCISYLTIEQKNELPESLRQGLGQHIFGCDLCQAVCPWNRRAPVTKFGDFHPMPGLMSRTLSDWLSLSEEDFKRLFHGTSIKRTKWHRFMRNVIIAAGNSANSAYIKQLLSLRKAGEALLLPHIDWSVKRLLSKS